MFQYNNYHELISATRYESKKAYLNRLHDVNYDTLEFSYTEEESQNIFYLYKLMREYFAKREETRLQEEAKRLQEEADNSTSVQ